MNQKKKCIKRVNEVIQKEDVTLLLVTHVTSVAKEFCKRGIVIDQGKIICDGTIDTAIKEYSKITK